MAIKPFLRIGSDVIDADSNCYVIAEIGHNHQGSLEQAKKLFDAAKEAGADAVKLQKRNNRTMYTKAFYNSAYNSENAYAPTYGEHREFLEFGHKEYAILAAHAKSIGITFFSTAFDIESADFLEEFDMPCYKIASGDLTNIPLIRHVAAFGKPMIISTGGAVLQDVERAYAEIIKVNPQLCIMQCTSGYPCKYEEMNLKVIETYQRHFPRAIIGLSAHDNGIAMSVAGYAMGARIVEKHFTLDRSLKGTDHAFSLERPGLARLVRDLRRTRTAMGDGIKCPYESEKGPLTKMQKSLVAARDLPKGHRITRADVKICSPGTGLLPFEMDNILGCVTQKALAEDDLFSYENLGLAQTISLPLRTLPERVAQLKMVVIDFDGVLTDNKVFVSETGEELVVCSRADGIGMKKLESLGLKTLILSSETNPVVKARTQKLGVECVQGCENKKTELQKIARKAGVSLHEIAFIGNDINDRECLEMVGVPIIVQDAIAELRPLASYQTQAAGGQGAVREACEWIASLYAAPRSTSAAA